MNERETRQLQRGKAEIAVARMIYKMYLFIAVASTTAIAVSLPSAILDVLPKWADITMAVSGALNLPGSVGTLPKMRRWINDANQTIEEFEGSQNS